MSTAYAKFSGLVSGGGGGSGTVTSVALADGSTTPIYTVTGSPVTTSGTLTETLKTQVKNTLFVGPATGADAQPTFRTIVAADVPIDTILPSQTGNNGKFLTTNGSAASWGTAGGGSSFEFHIGPKCNTESTPISNAGAFVTFSNSPTLTFTAGATGTYLICASPALQFNDGGSGGGGNNGFAQIGATSGSPTVLANNGSTMYFFATSLINITQKFNPSLFLVVNLTATNSYSFDLQGFTGDAGTSIEIQASDTDVYIYAMRVA